MADATYLAIDARSSIGEYKITLHYDSVSLLITSADILNTTGDPQPLEVTDPASGRSFKTTIANGTNTSQPLSTFNIHMIDGPRGPAPPYFVG